MNPYAIIQKGLNRVQFLEAVDLPILRWQWIRFLGFDSLASVIGSETP